MKRLVNQLSASSLSYLFGPRKYQTKDDNYLAARKGMMIMVLILLGCSLSASAQQQTIDVVAMHQLIDESKTEHTAQVKARNQQAVNTANEQANLSLLTKLKNMYRTLQQRYNTLGTLITVADVGIQAEPMVRQIVSYQALIVQQVQKNPAVAVLGYQTEIEFAGKAEALSGYVAGLLLSYGDVNQMKASDRKLLFDEVIRQLSVVQELSGNMLSLLQYNNLASVIKALNPFQSWINADADMAKNIIANAKYLKQ